MADNVNSNSKKDKFVALENFVLYNCLLNYQLSQEINKFEGFNF